MGVFGFVFILFVHSSLTTHFFQLFKKKFSFSVENIVHPPSISIVFSVNDCSVKSFDQLKKQKFFQNDRMI